MRAVLRGSKAIRRGTRAFSNANGKECCCGDQPDPSVSCPACSDFCSSAFLVSYEGLDVCLNASGCNCQSAPTNYSVVVEKTCPGFGFQGWFGVDWDVPVEGCSPGVNRDMHAYIYCEQPGIYDGIHFPFGRWVAVIGSTPMFGIPSNGELRWGGYRPRSNEYERCPPTGAYTNHFFTGVGIVNCGSCDSVTLDELPMIVVS